MKCQGRTENGVCPDNRNDNTVHNTIGDVFLCHACEEYCWPTAPSDKTAMSKKQNSKPATGKSANAKKNSHQQMQCDRCLTKVDANMTAQCDVCEYTFDQECSGVPNDTFQMLLAMVQDTSWVCNDCRSEQRGTVGKLRAEVAAANQVVADMKVVLQELRRDFDSLGNRDTNAKQLTTATTNPTDTSSLSVVICCTVFEINKRKKKCCSDRSASKRLIFR